MIINQSHHADSPEEPRRQPETPRFGLNGRIDDLTYGDFPSWAETAAVAATTTAVVPYVKAIMEELGKRTVDVAPKIYRSMICRFRFCTRDSKRLVKTAEIDLKFNDDEVTTVVLTNELPEFCFLTSI